MRVVYVDHCAQLSGGEIALLNLLEAMPEVQPLVLLAEDGPFADRLRTQGISVEVMPMPERTRSLRRHRIPAGVGLATVVDSVVYSLRLTRRLRVLRPDLVHTNSLKAALYGGAAAKLARCPVVWHVRDRIADDYLPKPAVQLVRALARWLPDAVIANSRSTLETLQFPYRLSVVVPSPVIYDPVTVQPARHPAGKSPLRVGMVGRIAPWKGQHLFLRAFASAFSEGEEQAVIVGAPLFGEDEVAYEEELRRLTAQLGIADRVEFTGFQEDVGAQLARMDVLVHASTVPEPFGQVVVEGMMAGLAVVAPATGGPAEVVEDGRTGLLYPLGRVEALAAVLRRLAEDGDLRRRLGAAAREAAKRFTPEEVAPRVMDVYRRVLARRT